jgi:hypothetical protein
MSMSRFSAAELKQFRDTSHCSAGVHYSSCALWLSLLLMNEEFSAPGLELRCRTYPNRALCFSLGRRPPFGGRLLDQLTIRR